MQYNDILLMSKLFVEREHNNTPTWNPEFDRSTMFFKLNKCKKEKSCGEFVYLTERVINSINKQNPVCQHCWSKIAKHELDVEHGRQQNLWFKPV